LSVVTGLPAVVKEPLPRRPRRILPEWTNRLVLFFTNLPAIVDLELLEEKEDRWPPDPE